MQIPRLSNIDWTRTILALVAIVAVSSALWNWYHPKVSTVTRDNYIQVPVEKKVETIKRVMVPGPKEIQVIEKEKIVERLKIPDPTASNPNIQVTGNADIPPSETGTSVISTIDTTTGETTIIAKEKPQPLFGFPSDKEVSIRYGVSTRDGQTGALAARWQFLRIGVFRVGAYGELGTRPEAKAMLEASYRF